MCLMQGPAVMGFDVNSVIGNVSIAITESVTVLPINGNHTETDFF